MEMTPAKLAEFSSLLLAKASRPYGCIRRSHVKKRSAALNHS
jgi:hypothetical protein